MISMLYCTTSKSMLSTKKFGNYILVLLLYAIDDGCFSISYGYAGNLVPHRYLKKSGQRAAKL